MNSRSAGRLWAALKPMPYRFQSSSTRQFVRPFSQTCLRQSDASSGNPPPGASEANPAAPEAKTESTPESTPTTSDLKSTQTKPPPAAATPRVDSMAQLSSLLGSSSSTTTKGGPAAGPSVSGTSINLGSQVLNKALNHNSDSILGGTSEGGDSVGFNNDDLGPAHEPFHFHVKSHRRNCHITVTKPDRGAILSMSTGNIGFRKAKRGSYDAAYQLAAYVVDKLHQGNWHRRIGSLEVVLSGFGHGREAVTKVLMGSEGRMLRGSIVKVSDATKLKFGGTRSKRPRRL